MTNTIPKSIIVNDVEYFPANSIELSKNTEGLEYCIVRTYSAGVFAGYVKSQDGKNAVVLQARRLWQWSGAATLSQLAVDGTSKPSNCKFPVEVPEVRLTEVIEVLPTTEKARQSIASVQVWAQ